MASTKSEGKSSIARWCSQGSGCTNCFERLFCWLMVLRQSIADLTAAHSIIDEKARKHVYLNITLTRLSHPFTDDRFAPAGRGIKRHTVALSAVAGALSRAWEHLLSSVGRHLRWIGSSRCGWCKHWLGITLLVVWASLAAPNLDQLQQLAFDRYGADVARLVARWRAMLPTQAQLRDEEKLERVNNFFNREVRWVPDSELWQQEDYWATLLETLSKGAGDCEDFAIAKYVSLLIAGVQESKLRLTYVRFQQYENEAPIAHMVLAYYADPTSEPLILDNVVREIKAASGRQDLTPVYSFNATHLWFRGPNAAPADPTARISRWRDVLARLQAEYTL